MGKQVLPTKIDALPGRETALENEDSNFEAQHFVLNNKILPPFPSSLQKAMFGLGCFWGAERKFWLLEGVYASAVGYAAGITPNPSYQEVCSGMTGHNEVVLVIYDENILSYDTLLKVFWESHNPTQGMQQGNDRGTQYRSGIYTYSASHQEAALKSRQHFQSLLSKNGLDTITTEIIDAPKFYYAESYHQQYLAKNPSGYCGLGGLNIEY